MESGLVGRNNPAQIPMNNGAKRGLNGVRPSWPEQCFAKDNYTMLDNLSQWSPA